MIVVDQHLPSEEYLLGARGAYYAERPLADGRRFTIVKVFYDLDSLQDRLVQHGFAPTIHHLDGGFFLLEAEAR